LTNTRRTQVCASRAEAGDTGNGAVELVVEGGVLVVLPLAGLFDAAKEVARLQRQRAKLEKDQAGLLARVSNPRFAQSAPPAIVAEANAQAKELADKIALIDEKILQTQSLC